MKNDEFKKFVRNNPQLINYVKSNQMTWQQFYEIYDLYGENDNIWNDFKNNSSENNSDSNIINDSLKFIEFKKFLNGICLKTSSSPYKDL